MGKNQHLQMAASDIIQTVAKPKAIQRAAIYSRVSTDMEIQEGSFDIQNRYFLQRIENDPTMELVDVYGDFGKSGRSIEKRDAFQRLIQDCEDGKIDVILTKSISRFARNFVDCMETLKRLKELGIRVIFDENGIDTLDMKSELVLGILAAIAEEESNSISANMQWAIDERAKKGEPLTRPPYGYRRARKSTVWTVVESEAQRVKYAFDRGMAGVSYAQIAGELNRMEAEENTGKQWTGGMVKCMLQNIAYQGDYLSAKMIRVGRKTKKNEGEKEQFYLENHHPAIISREDFSRMQTVIDSRRINRRVAA